MTLVSKFQGQHLERAESYVVNLTRNQKYQFYKGILNYAELSGVSAKDLLGTCGALTSDGNVCRQALPD